MSDTEDWPNVVNLDGLPLRPDVERPVYATAMAALASRMGARKLGFHLEELAPGAFSCPYHFHHGEEELFLVLGGTAMLRQAGRFREVGPGDLIFFPTGPEGAHQFHNHGTEPFRFLALSTMEALEVCEYPDSGKVMVSATRGVFVADRAVDYWLDEEDPARAWPADALGEGARQP